MKTWSGFCRMLSASLIVLVGSIAQGGEYFAVKSGNWSDPTTWNQAVVPSSDDIATISSPGGTTVKLTSDQSIDTLFLGGAGGAGVLDLGGFTLSGGVIIGSDGTGTVLRNGGKMVGSRLLVGGNNTITLGSEDRFERLSVFGAASMTLTSRQNVSSYLYSDGTLTLNDDFFVDQFEGGGLVHAKNHSLSIGSFARLSGVFEGLSSLTITNNLVIQGETRLTFERASASMLVLLSSATINQAATSREGLTLSSGVFIDGQLNLQFSGVSDSWLLRVQNPSDTEDWVIRLFNYYRDGKIRLSGAEAYQIRSRDGFTYIETALATPTPVVPEPSTLASAAIGLVCAGFGARRARLACQGVRSERPGR